MMDLDEERDRYLAFKYKAEEGVSNEIKDREIRFPPGWLSAMRVSKSIDEHGNLEGYRISVRIVTHAALMRGDLTEKSSFKIFIPSNEDVFERIKELVRQK